MSINKMTKTKDGSIQAWTEMRAASIKALTETTEALTKDVNILCPLGENAIEIRKLFFATYRSQKRRRKYDDRSTILLGNLATYGGKVGVDARLFKNGLIEYEDTLIALYGLSWLEAESLLCLFPFTFVSPPRITKHANTQPPRIRSSLLGTVYSGGCIFGCSAIALFVFPTRATIRI